MRLLTDASTEDVADGILGSVQRSDTGALGCETTSPAQEPVRPDDPAFSPAGDLDSLDRADVQGLLICQYDRVGTERSFHGNAANVIDDFLLAFGLIDRHALCLLQPADFARDAGALVEQPDDDLVDAVDIPAKILKRRHLNSSCNRSRFSATERTSLRATRDRVKRRAPR